MIKNVVAIFNAQEERTINWKEHENEINLKLYYFMVNICVCLLLLLVKNLSYANRNAKS